MELEAYIQKTFPGVELKPSLYLQWPRSIHFELGEGIYQLKENDELNMERFEAVYRQTLTLFNELFAEEDELAVVVNVYHERKRNAKTKPFHVFRKYLKERSYAYRVKLETHPYVFDDEEEAEGRATSRYYLKCRKQDINYSALLKATCNEDFPLKPKFRREKGMYYPDVFFINPTKNAIFFIYDDRGCEVIAAETETLRPLYEKYDEWLYEENRDDMNRLFT